MVTRKIYTKNNINNLTDNKDIIREKNLHKNQQDQLKLRKEEKKKD